MARAHSTAHNVHHTAHNTQNTAHTAHCTSTPCRRLAEDRVKKHTLRKYVHTHNVVTHKHWHTSNYKQDCTCVCKRYKKHMFNLIAICYKHMKRSKTQDEICTTIILKGSSSLNHHFGLTRRRFPSGVGSFLSLIDQQVGSPPHIFVTWRCIKWPGCIKMHRRKESVQQDGRSI